MELPKMYFLLICFLVFFLHQSPTSSAIKQSYIVYLGSHSHGPEITNAQLDAVANHHHQLLGSYLGSTEKARDAILYSYKYHINGFAATLEDEHAVEIAKHPDVISVFRNQGRKLHTTHSWDFMSLENNGFIHPSSIWRRARFGKDVIIGNLDTGVWPESKSFSDEGYGYGPVPSRWKGLCQNESTAGVPCNRKLIGARYFNKGYIAGGGDDKFLNTARDYNGHGSHTLSTAAGNFVPKASILGVNEGAAKGGSPRARVASYKVCWKPVNGDQCFDADILKAFDVAIHDGVDVLSISLGGAASDYFSNAITLGAFHAVQNGIVVVCSAGNDGPTAATVNNTAPWVLTVGASTIDREFQTYVKLRNGLRFKGKSLSSAMPQYKLYPMINAREAKSSNASAEDALLCKPGTLDPNKVKGKILVCLRGITTRVDKSYQALLAGAIGMILCNDAANGNNIAADPHFLPAAQLTYKDGLDVFAYLNSSDYPLGHIESQTSAFNIKPAPVMANFSSVGPNILTPEILKPDVTAPGVDIIAAFSEAVNPTDTAYDKRRTPFNIMSGTSMACPHAAGVVGLLKTLHPDWSTAAIRSAIMTTARTTDNTVKPMHNAASVKATPFNYGSGHIRPNRAMDPGLVYDVKMDDYLDFLCSQGYNETIIKMFNRDWQGCDKFKSVLDLNYPSISVPNLNGSVTMTRRLKNVGFPGTYAALVQPPAGIEVSVEPKALTFLKYGEEKSFKLTLKSKESSEHTDYLFGGLTWSDGRHYVRSPIVVRAVGY